MVYLDTIFYPTVRYEWRDISAPHDVALIDSMGLGTTDKYWLTTKLNPTLFFVSSNASGNPYTSFSRTTMWTTRYNHLVIIVESMGNGNVWTLNIRKTGNSDKYQYNFRKGFIDTDD